MNPVDLILKDLNPAQQEAVSWAPDKPLLVLAGAGSGKTRILTRRIAFLISQGVPSFSVLGVTFTNKAAEEMKRRVQKLVRHDVWVSTFHSTCLKILREDIPALSMPKDFVIYDEQDQLVIIKECMKLMNVSDREIHPKGAREMIQRAKDFLLSPFQFAEKAVDVYEETVAKIYQRYEERLMQLGGLDFGDLISKTVSLFDRHPKVLEKWQERFRHVLIDEYQDTNHAQYRLVKLLASRFKQITAVGDPDQSIYGWRGADVRNILNFEEDYPDSGMIKMEQNYRSPTVILDAANQLIQHNQYRKPKLLWSEKGEGEKITLYEAGDEREEAGFVVQEILDRRKSGRTLNEMSIFYRVHAQSRPLEDALRRAQLPYKIVGGIRFYDRKEVKDLLAYLRSVAFPHDDVSLKRILNTPHRGIGKKAIELLEEYQRGKGINFNQALAEAAQVEGLGPRAAKAISDFFRMILDFRRMENKGPIRKLLEQIIDRTAYVRFLEEERTVEASARIENIQEFFSAVDEFEEGEQKGNLKGFIESITLVTDLDSWEGGSNCLTLMTLHCAKGLEFPIVFMVGLETGLFPHMNSLEDGVDDALEEERRLCYVGITRAQEKLYITYAGSRRMYGRLVQNLPSRFLTEIPPELLESQGGLASFDRDEFRRETDRDYLNHDYQEDH